MQFNKDNSKILLIRPNVHIDIADFSGFSFAEPLDLGYFAAYAKAENIDSDIIDMLIDKKTDIIKLLKTKKYAMVVFTGHVTAAAKINALAKMVNEFDKNIFTIVTGIMAAVNPHVYDTVYIDAIIQTDPYDTFTQILKKLQTNDTDFISLKGVYHKDKAQAEIVKYVPKYFPLREKIAKYAKHYSHSYLGPCVSIKTSYGCPNNCSFCLYAKGGYDKYWERDLEDVFLELEHIKETDIMILDDNFTANIKRAEAFCEGLEKRSIKKTFFILATPQTVADNPNLFERLYDNGLRYVFLGIESFNDEELKKLNKRNTAKDNHAALDFLTKLGIEINTGIICMPGHKQEDFDLVIKNLSRYNPIFPMVNVLTPMPGTPMYNEHEKQINTQKHEAFNMMEHIIKPLYMTPKQFYGNILTVYKKTNGSQATLDYIKDKYGKRTLKKHKKISRKVLWKFIKLMMR